MTYKVPFVNYPEYYRCMENEIYSAIEEVLSKGSLRLQLVSHRIKLTTHMRVTYFRLQESCWNGTVSKQTRLSSI